VQRGRYTRHGDHRHFDDQRRPITPTHLVVFCNHVPDTRADQDNERRPRHPVERASRRLRDISPEPPQRRDERCERELPANPHARGEDVQKQSYGAEADGQHALSKPDRAMDQRLGAMCRDLLSDG